MLVLTTVFGVGSVGGLSLAPPRGRAAAGRGPGWLTDGDRLRITAAVLTGRVAVGFVVVFVAFALHGSDDATGLVADRWLAHAVPAT